MSEKKRICVFCGTGKLTREHVFPNWMSKLFDPKTEVTTVLEQKGEIKNSFTSLIFQHKAKIVCSNCNGGWMSDIESGVEPILKPMLFDLNCQTKLGEYEQKVLALWAQKTAMILCKSTGADYEIPKESYEQLFVSKESPISNISVRLGWRIPKSDEKGSHLSHFTISQLTGPISAEHEESLRGAEAWRAIIAIGNIVFHLTGSTSHIVVELGNNDPRVSPQIFPYKSDISWPNEWPVDAMTSTGFEEFKDV